MTNNTWTLAAATLFLLPQVDFGELVLDTNKLMWQQTVALKNIPQVRHVHLPRVLMSMVHGVPLARGAAVCCPPPCHGCFPIMLFKRLLPAHKQHAKACWRSPRTRNMEHTQPATSTLGIPYRAVPYHAVPYGSLLANHAALPRARWTIVPVSIGQPQLQP